MNDEIGRILGYKQEFSFTIFSKLRKESTIKDSQTHEGYYVLLL